MISVTILVKDGARSLKETLDALTSFNEVILYDTGSTDETVAIAKRFPNVVVFQKEFQGFGKTHNSASGLAKHDWILSIDADEVLSKELVAEIQSTPLEKGKIYSISRENYFNGKKIKWCGWQGERVIRLYNRAETEFSDAFVHEEVLRKNLHIQYLKNPMKHTPYLSISDFLKKMEHYSTLFATQKMGKKKSNPALALLHGAWAFCRSFFLKKGFLGGYEGLLISLYNGHTTFYKYLKLYHLNAHHTK